MTAGQLFTDVKAILAAPLRPPARLLWLYVLTQDDHGEISNQTREEIAHALNINRATVTAAAKELEDTGWMACDPRHGVHRPANDAKGWPEGPEALAKVYRCLRPYRGKS